MEGVRWLTIILCCCCLLVSGNNVVIDAGSSSSKLNIMRNDGVLLTPLRTIIPGLSDFQNQQRVACIKIKNAPSCAIVNGTVTDYINYLSQFVTATVRPEVTQVFLLGTAGMRSLETGAALRLYEDSNSVFQGLGYYKVITRTINGYEEALFSWITVNSDATKSENTFGVLDLGGVSAQITYATTNVGIPSITHIHTKFGKVNTFLKSYQGLGLDAALQTYIGNISLHSGPTLNSPCLPLGSIATVDLVNNNLFKQSILGQLSNNGITMIQGTANLQDCLAAYNNIVLENVPQGILDELGNQISGWTGSIPARLNETNPFIMVGAYVNVLGAETSLSLNSTLQYTSDIVNKIEVACSPSTLDWSYVQTLPTLQARQGAVRRCADFALILALLARFELNGTSTFILQATASWGPGAAIVLGDSDIIETPSSLDSKLGNILGLVITISIIAMLLFFGFIIVLIWLVARFIDCCPNVQNSYKSLNREEEIDLPTKKTQYKIMSFKNV